MYKSALLPNLRLNVLDRGRGTTILFVHGFPLSHAMWQGQQVLGDRCRVIMPDLRGFGQSQVIPGTSTMAEMADDLARMLDELRVDRPVALCGLSMGGYIAFQFAKRHPARLDRLVLCDTKAAADTPEAAATRLKMAEHVLNHGTSAVAEAMPAKLFAASTFAEQPRVVAAVKKMIEETDPAGLAAAQRGMAEREDVRSWLPQINVPTLVVVGREDMISPVDEMRAIAEAIPGAKFEVIERAGHMAPMERPEEFNRLLREFVGR
jgi:pimeloyl-ACP methyl ester carboxylesterase